MRKLTTILLAILLVFHLTVPALAVTIDQEVSGTNIVAGSDVTVTLTLDEALTGLGSFEYTLHYNKELFSLKSYESSVDVTDKPAKGEVMLSLVYDFSGDSGLTIAEGTFAVLVFTAKQDMSAAQGATFKLECVDVTDLDFDSVEVSQTNAEILDELLTKWKETGYTFSSVEELF